MSTRSGCSEPALATLSTPSTASITVHPDAESLLVLDDKNALAHAAPAAIGARTGNSMRNVEP